MHILCPFVRAGVVVTRLSVPLLCDTYHWSGPPKYQEWHMQSVATHLELIFFSQSLLSYVFLRQGEPTALCTPASRKQYDILDNWSPAGTRCLCWCCSISLHSSSAEITFIPFQFYPFHLCARQPCAQWPGNTYSLFVRLLQCHTDLFLQKDRYWWRSCGWNIPRY